LSVQARGWLCWRDLLTELLQREVELSAAQWGGIFEQLARFEFLSIFDHTYLPALVKRFAQGRRERVGGALGESVQAVANTIAASGRAEEQRLVRALRKLGEAPASLPIQAGEV